MKLVEIQTHQDKIVRLHGAVVLVCAVVALTSCNESHIQSEGNRVPVVDSGTDSAATSAPSFIADSASIREGTLVLVNPRAVEMDSYHSTNASNQRRSTGALVFCDDPLVVVSTRTVIAGMMGASAGGKEDAFSLLVRNTDGTSNLPGGGAIFRVATMNDDGNVETEQEGHVVKLDIRLTTPEED